MCSSDFDSRISALECRVDKVCRFLGSVFSTSSSVEVQPSRQSVSQLDLDSRHCKEETKKKSENNIKEKIEELCMIFKQSMEDIFTKCQEEMKGEVDKLEARLKKSEEMFEGEKKKELALELFDVDIKDDLANFKIKDKSIKQIGVDHLSGLSLLMSQYKKVSLENCFRDCKQLTILDFPSTFNTSNVTSMRYMFRGCKDLVTLDLSTFNTSSVTDMGGMFYECSSLSSLDLSTFNTDKVTDMGCMFSYCSSLTSVNLSTFNTGSVQYMNGMFYNCYSLSSLDLSTFNTSSVGRDGRFSGCTDMFYGCYKLNEVYADDSRIKSNFSVVS